MVSGCDLGPPGAMLSLHGRMQLGGVVMGLNVQTLALTRLECERANVDLVGALAIKYVALLGLRPFELEVHPDRRLLFASAGADPTVREYVSGWRSDDCPALALLFQRGSQQERGVKNWSDREQDGNECLTPSCVDRRALDEIDRDR